MNPPSPHDLAVLFFLQIAVILVACRVVGRIARAVGQPPVVAEMVAGVLLGPSLFGWLMPATSAWLFPPESKPILYVVAQLGLVLYMFVVGVEFRVDLISTRLRGAMSVSIAGIVTPFALGALIATYLVRDPRMFAPGVTTLEAVLFVGASMCITAFPMLARIIHERGLTGTRHGTLALAAAAIDDAIAWCLLAVVLASFGRDPAIAAIAIGGGVLYAIVVRFGVRPFLKWRWRGAGPSADRALPLVLLLVLLGALWTDHVRIYAVFGAFLMGLAIPNGKLKSELPRLLLPLTTTLLLPVFFVYSGLNTRFTLVSTPGLLALTLVILVAASVGKGVACGVAALRAGERPAESVAIGALMNARGMMELILLDIGYRSGVITQTLFSILVLMAIVTTLMATPIFERACVRSPTSP